MIHIITASRNRREKTAAFIDSIKKQTYKNIHLIIVDDNSSDGTRKMVRRLMPEASIIKGNGNLWWGGAMHAAYHWVRKHLNHRRDDFILITNDDVEYDSDYIQKGINCVKSTNKGIFHGEGVDACTGKIIDTVYHIDYSRNWRQTIFVKSTDGKGECSSSRSLFMTVETFLDAGAFHPHLLPHYGSDTEWTMRAARKGHPIYADKNLIYIMNESAVSNKCIKKGELKKVFRKNSGQNPFYRIVFILISTPLRYIPNELAKQLLRYVYRISRLKKF